MKLYSLQMEIKLQLYEITFSHLQQRTQKFESQRNPLTQSINKETLLRCNLRASYRSACFCLKNRIQIAQRTQTVDSSEWVTIFQAVTQDIIKSRKQAPVRKKKKKNYLFYLTIFKWRTKHSFAIRPWNTSSELPCGFPVPPYNQPLTRKRQWQHTLTGD